jgi:AcrR family transcriptional regulator
VGAAPEHLRASPVGRERLPREELEAHRRDRALDAAAPVFAGRGYEASTVDELVAAARIGVGSFYALFAGREDCFLALYDRTVEEARRELAAAVPGDAAWPERYRAGLRRALELAAAEPDRARVVLVEAQAAGPAARARRAELLDELAAVLSGARGVERAGDPLPPRFERATAAGLAWLLQQRLASGDPLRVEELLPEMTRIALEAYPA